MEARMLNHTTETLLMVDDEPLMTDLFRQFMTKRGFQVLIASSGEEALETLTTEAENVDLIITDMTMPGMDGKELARILAQRYANIPVLIITGHDVDVAKTEGLANVVGMIQKPYQNRALAERIREILDARAAGS